MVGRNQESPRCGPTYRLAEFLNDNWERVGKTNREVTDELGLRSPNIVSMWRTGATKVALTRLPQIAVMLGLPTEDLLVLWFEQYTGDDPVSKRLFDSIVARIVTVNEMQAVTAIRRGSKTRAPLNKDQLQAIEMIACDPAQAKRIVSTSTR